MNLIERPLYINKLFQLMNRNEIKILTGIRGAGKSSILKMFIQNLIERGIEKDNIIYFDSHSHNINFDFIKNSFPDNLRKYLFIDEVQNIQNWQLEISKLKANFDVDIYLSSSVISIVDEKIYNIFGHTPIEIDVLPLSFKEYQTFFKNDDFNSYLLYGGMPELAMTKSDCALQNIFFSALAQDVFAINKIADNGIIIKLIKIMLQEISNIHSFNSLSKLLANSTSHIYSVKTVENYINMLTNAKLFYSVPVFDTKSHNNLTRYAKYYPADIGLYNVMFDALPYDSPQILESIVYFELIRLGAKVSTCKVGNKKVAFVAETEDNKIYLQVTNSLKDDDDTFLPLRSINDHYSKWILTLDKVYAHSEDGIRIINLIDFLLDE